MLVPIVSFERYAEVLMSDPSKEKLPATSGRPTSALLIEKLTVVWDDVSRLALLT